MTNFDDSLSLLLAADDDELMRYQVWNGRRVELPADAYVDVLIERAVQQYSDRTALVYRDEVLSYRAFWQRVVHGSRILMAAGARPGTAVAIALPPGVERMVAVVAALHCGASYLPLNLDHPTERLRRQFDDCGQALLVATSATAQALGIDQALDLGAAAPAVAGDALPLAARQVSDYAYIIHTSGSTGQPKGCAIRHDSLYNRLVWMRDALQVGPDDRILHKTAFGFDVSVWEQLLPLMTGATLVIADTEDARDAHRLAGLIARHQVSLCHFVPTLLDAFLDQDSLEGCASLRAIVCSGEALPKATALRCSQRLDAALYNYYGPTEAAIDVTAWRFDPEQDYGFVPIGLPIDNVDAHVLRDDLTPAPVGAEGELYLGGIAVGAGYLRRPAQSAERFIPDPFSALPGARMYRTGDIVRRHADGAIEYLGRRDMQVKLRGFRIELGEIEEVLRKHPGVSQAAVIVSDEPRQLLAYIVPSAGRSLAEIEAELRTAAAKALPVYMVPAVWIGLATMPTTVNGKLDRNALPKPVRAAAGTVPLSGEREETLATIWQNLLGLPEIDASTNFFAAGGDSILAIKLVARARAQGLRFEVNDVFAHPTVRALAAQAQGISDAQVDTQPAPASVALWQHGFSAQDCIVAVLDWKAPEGEVEAGLARLDQLLLNRQPGLQPGLRLPATGMATLNRLVAELAAAPQRTFAAARDGQKLMLALPPHSADWSSLPRLASLLEANDQAISSVDFRQWADNARQLPAPSLERPAAGAKATANPYCQSGHFALPANWQQRQTSSGGAEDPLIDLISAAALTAMAATGVKRVRCRLPESRAWAAQTGWELSHCFGRLALEVAPVLSLANWHMASEQFMALRSLRSGLPGAPEFADEPAQNCRVLVVTPPTDTTLNWTAEYLELLAQTLAVEDELLLVALLEADQLRFCWSGQASLVSRLMAPTLQALDEGCHTQGPQRLAQDFPDSGLPSSRPLAGPLAQAADAYPLAPMQEGMLLRSIYWPESDAYFNQNLIELHGPLQRQALVDAWMTVVGRYEALRTGYAWEGLESPVQHIAAKTRHGVCEHDWQDCSTDEAAIEARLAAFMDADRSLPFDLREPGLWRFNLIHLTPERHFLVWSHHHILLDGWCLSLIWGDVFKHYAATVEGRALPPQRPRPYRDYLTWLRHHGAARRNPAFWRDYLDGYDAPTLFSRHSPDTEGRFDTWRIKLTPEKTEGLNQLARQCEITVNAIIQAAWSLMLGMETGRSDVIHGVAVSGRPPELDGSEQMVGLFINTIPLRLRHQAGQRVSEFLRQTQRTLAEASRQADLPLAEIAGQWRGRRYGDERLFDSLIAFENYPENNLPQGKTGGLDIIDRFCDEKTEYPFGLIVLPGKTLELHFNFDTAHFAPAEVERLTWIYRGLLDAMINEPDGVLANLPGPLLPVLQSAAPAQGDLTLHAAIALQGQTAPTALALIDADRRWTYQEMAAEIEACAASWSKAGVTCGQVVLLMQPRSARLAIHLLALWHLGAIPAVLNAGHPPAIRQACAALVQPDWLLADGEAALPGTPLPLQPLAGVGGVPPAVKTSGRMILFTSGSTGQPKAVLCHQAGLLERIRTTASLYGSQKPVLLANAAAGFDIGLWELFFPLVQGGTVVIASETSLRDFSDFAEQIRLHGVDTLHLIPSLLELLLDAARPDQLASLKAVVSGGETLPASLVRRWFAQGLSAALWQGYGPTEASISVVDHLCRPEEGEAQRVPLGQPSGGASVYLLDEWLRPTPVGVEGDLYLAGENLCQGYVGAAAATAEAFLPDPWGEPGSLMYRTGDRAILRADGLLEFHGRKDRQIKLRGQRIDLGMLEQIVARHPAVRDAAVVVAAGTTSTLTAHLCLRDGADPAVVEALPQWLSTELPYGLTLPIRMHTALPVNANGKLDRRALAALPVTATASEGPLEGPQNPVEEAVWAAWTEVMGSAPTHRHSNFFSSGGHSLAAMRLVLAVRRRLDASAKVEVTHLFKFPTVAGMAEAIHSGAGGSGRDHVLVVSEPAAPSATPLFLIHPVEGMALCYATLGEFLPERPIYAFSNPRQLERDKFASLAEMARLYVEWVRSLAGDGPVMLGGWSFGGVVALEMARQMRAHGSTVETVLLIDSYQLAGQHALMLQHDAAAPTEALRDEIRHNTALALAATPAPYPGRVVLLQAEDDTSALGPANGWSTRHLPDLTLRPLQGGHHDLFKPEFLASTALAIRAALEESPQ